MVSVDPPVQLLPWAAARSEIPPPGGGVGVGVAVEVGVGVAVEVGVGIAAVLVMVKESVKLLGAVEPIKFAETFS